MLLDLLQSFGLGFLSLAKTIVLRSLGFEFIADGIELPSPLIEFVGQTKYGDKPYDQENKKGARMASHIFRYFRVATIAPTIPSRSPVSIKATISCGIRKLIITKLCEM